MILHHNAGKNNQIMHHSARSVDQEALVEAVDVDVDAAGAADEPESEDPDPDEPDDSDEPDADPEDELELFEPPPESVL